MPELNWDGKDAAKTLAADTPLRLLKLNHEYTCNADSKNLIVQGDNLAALKSLLPFYRARVKCIYIDPPYNTGSAFENYSDNYPHSDWLNMIFPRLQILRDFLADDGAIFISIDDNEQAYLKIICDEIFGRDNFVATVIWERAYAPVNLKKHFSTSHDYIICYAKNFSSLVCNGLPRTGDADKRYKNPDNDPRGVWKSDNFSVGPAVEKNIYEIITPNGRKVLPPKGYSWRYSKEKFAEMLKDNRVYFGENGNNVPSVKRFLSEVKQSVTPMTIWKYTEVGHSQDATKSLKEIFDGQAVFEYPKPVDLIKRCLELYSDKNSIILDAFAGSGTTAHAVINLNAADGGNRRFILIEEKDYCKTITAERVKRIGGDYKFYEMGEKLFEGGEINPAVTFEELAKFVWYSETKTPLTSEIKSPLLGIYNGAAIYLLEKVLAKKALAALPTFDGAKIIYGTACRFNKKFLNEQGITFKRLTKFLKSM